MESQREKKQDRQRQLLPPWVMPTHNLLPSPPPILLLWVWVQGWGSGAVMWHTQYFNST